jgi:hypothetical protein
MLGAPPLATARGPLSASVVGALAGSPGLVDQRALEAADTDDDDLQLALYVLYELHYRGWEGVDPDREWDPAVVALRRRLEARFVALLHDEVGNIPTPDPDDLVDALVTAIEGAEGSSLSSWVDRHGTIRHLRELGVHRSPYQLKEADPHTWAIPRLPAGAAKSALLQLQFDEYGHGRPEASHAELFAETMRSLDLDDGYGAYLDLVPGVTLATVNLLSMFGLQRRWVGACLGHLAVFEMTSVVPMTRYARAHRRVTGEDAGAEFYDVHVVADAVHEQIADVGLLRPLMAEAPELGPEVIFGARTLLALERRFTEHVLRRWERHRTSLRAEVLPAAAAS